MLNVLSSKALRNWVTKSLVLGLLAVPGFSSASNELPLSDIANNPNKDAILKLNYAGVVKGYTDGTFKPNKEVSRAEFATMAVLALGYTEEQVKMFNGPTKFTDLPDNHWANGFINLAVSKGIIKGYPDGTFQPNNTVKVAEALTVFVNGLNIEVPASTTGLWYHPFLLEANKVGMYDSAEAPTASANREVIAKYASKFMETPVYANGAYYDKDGNKNGSQKKLAVVKGVVSSFNAQSKELNIAGQDEALAISENAQVYGNVVAGAEVEYLTIDGKISFLIVKTAQADIVEGIVKSGLDFTTAVGDENQFKAALNGQEIVLTVANGVSVTNSHVGQKFTAIKDKDGKVVSISFTANEAAGLVEKTSVVTGTNAKKEITLNGQAYKLAQNATVSGKAHPLAAAAAANFNEIAKGDQVKLSLNADGEITAVEFTKLSATGEIAVNTAANKVTFDGKEYAIFANTKLLVNEAEVTELNKLSNGSDAVLTFDNKGNLVKVQQGTVQVEAEFVTSTTAFAAGTPATVTIDGKVYRLLDTATVKVDGEMIAVNTIEASRLNDAQVSSLKVNVGTHDAVELVVEKQSVQGFVTEKTNTTVTVNGKVYELANGVTVDADAATNDKEYTLTLNKDGQVKAITSAVKEVSGAVDSVTIARVNGAVTSAEISVDGTSYTAINAEALEGISQFEYVTLALKRDGKVASAAAVGTKAEDDVAFRGIETRVNGDRYVFYNNVSTSYKLTKDAVVKSHDGSAMSTSDLKTTDKVELWKNADNEVYLIVVEKK